MLKDKFSNCGSTKSETFWDYDDESVLCSACHKKSGKSWAKEHNKKSKSVSGIYLIVVLLSIALIFNLNGALTVSNYYSGAQIIDSSFLELEDGSIVEKSDYVSMAFWNLISLLVLIAFILVTIILLLTKNILGAYTYLITISIAAISNLINGNIIGIGVGIFIGIYIYNYLLDHPYLKK
jgi:hypothetical protein